MSNIIQEISDRISTPNKYSVPIPNRLEAIKYHDAELMLDIINGYYNEIGYRSYEYPIFKVFKDSEEQAEYCKSGNYEYYGSDDDSTTDYIYGMYCHRNEEKYYRI